MSDRFALLKFNSGRSGIDNVADVGCQLAFDKWPGQHGHVASSQKAQRTWWGCAAFVTILVITISMGVPNAVVSL